MSAKAFYKNLNLHKEKLSSPHFIFSAENPKFSENNTVKMDSASVLNNLLEKGLDSHLLLSNFNYPELVIITYGVTPAQIEELHQFASSLGQDSSIHSDGQNNEMRFHHGEWAGKRIQGKGITFHNNKPDDNYFTLPGNTYHFSHNLDLDKAEDDICMPKKDFIKEHVKLLDTLKHPTKEKLADEEEEQSKELKEKMDKAENPEAYKKLASQGMILGHHISINGQHNRADVGLPYHATVKLFDPAKDSHVEAHKIASQLPHSDIDPKNVGITPAVFKDRLGNDVYAIKLHGQHADEIAHKNSKFSHMGLPTNYKFAPHISVEKPVWDKIVQSKAKTAHEAGIKFGPMYLKQGEKVLHVYKKAPTKMAASESSSLETIEKGALKNIGSTLALAGSLALGTPTAKIAESSVNPKHTYDRGRMLNAISQVESSGGKFLNHRQLHGLHEGTHAVGRYALTPSTIKETLHLNKDLKSKFPKAYNLSGQNLGDYVKKNPELERGIAEKHLMRLEHHFGTNPAKLGFSWLNGVTGTNKAIKEGKDIENHWHALKVKQAYNEGK